MPVDSSSSREKKTNFMQFFSYNFVERGSVPDNYVSSLHASNRDLHCLLGNLFVMVNSEHIILRQQTSLCCSQITCQHFTNSIRHLKVFRVLLIISCNKESR